MQTVPDAVTAVLRTLHQAGFEAYLVGGCVRDHFLGRDVNDWDITTSALPDQVTECFAKVIPTGIAHGTVTIILNDEAVEVTTYRVDGDYSDGRRPDSVVFTPSLEEDLARRDFTINAMALNPAAGELVDPFGGRVDLEQGVIRAVGRPHDRLSEDGLRSFRAARFASQLAFEVDPPLIDAMGDTVDVFRLVSAERLLVELTKTVCGPHPARGLKILRDCGLLQVVLGEEFSQEDVDLSYPYSLPSLGCAWDCFSGALGLIMAGLPES